MYLIKSYLHYLYTWNKRNYQILPSSPKEYNFIWYPEEIVSSLQILGGFQNMDNKQDGAVFCRIEMIKFKIVKLQYKRYLKKHSPGK